MPPLRPGPRLNARSNRNTVAHASEGLRLQSGTHLALDRDPPVSRSVVPSAGRVVATPQVGALHHRYHRIGA